MLASIGEVFVVGTSSTPHSPPTTGISEYTYILESLEDDSGGVGIDVSSEILSVETI